MAVAIFKSPLRGDYHGSKGMEGKAAGRRRVFVQTETGCVLGMELDRSDNAHTVKRRLQLALNVSTEESSLTFGDLVLNNDLSAVRHDAPLLLTRNHMHRSSSTPCLSPSGKDIQRWDRSEPIEILGQSHFFDRMRPVVKGIVKGMKRGVEPLPISWIDQVSTTLVPLLKLIISEVIVSGAAVGEMALHFCELYNASFRCIVQAI